MYLYEVDSIKNTSNKIIDLNISGRMIKGTVQISWPYQDRSVKKWFMRSAIYKVLWQEKKDKKYEERRRKKLYVNILGVNEEQPKKK